MGGIIHHFPQRIDRKPEDAPEVLQERLRRPEEEIHRNQIAANAHGWMHAKGRGSTITSA